MCTYALISETDVTDKLPRGMTRLTQFRSTTMNKIGFITYNSLPGLQSGWINSSDGARSALIVQDTKGRGALKDGQRTRTTEEIRADIAKSWESLDASLSELDQVVIYVGDSGSEDAIERAAKKVPVEKLLFIGCSCGIERKEALVQSAGLGSACRILCECGGHRTMTAMVKSFLEGGAVFG